MTEVGAAETLKWVAAAGGVSGKGEPVGRRHGGSPVAEDRVIDVLECRGT